MNRVRAWIGLAAVLVVAGACTGPSPEAAPSASSAGVLTSPPTTAPVTPPPAGGRTFALPPPSTGARSAAAVRTRLCVRPPAPAPTPAQATEPPEAILEVEHEVEEVRHLTYIHPVAVDPVTHEELGAGLDQSFDHSYPRDLIARRSEVWSTIGVIPDGASLREAYHSFFSNQVIGYYDPASKQLVFIGSDNPSPLERVILAHELTHADDDQHFDLNRLSDLENACDDEELAASLGAVEGSAQYFSHQVQDRFFSVADLVKMVLEGGGSLPGDVPPFVQALVTWPYVEGERFVTILEAQGGIERVNSALRQFPVSTEQVIHPERFPDERPVPVDVPDLGPAIGSQWRDLDVMDVGEEWLKEMLALRVDLADAQQATDGWGGAQYRAWTDGSHVAVLTVTAWDTPEDADQFLSAAGTWIGDRDDAEAGPTRDPKTAVALFASDPATLAIMDSVLRTGPDA